MRGAGRLGRVGAQDVFCDGKSMAARGQETAAGTRVCLVVARALYHGDGPRGVILIILMMLLLLQQQSKHY